MQNVASGNYSIASGISTVASGQGSTAMGNGTIANHAYQNVFGRYNTEDPSEAAATARGNYVEIVGNGDVNTHSNARTLDWNGNEWLAGNIKVGGNSYSDANAKEVATKDYVDELTRPMQDTLYVVASPDNNTTPAQSGQQPLTLDKTITEIQTALNNSKAVVIFFYGLPFYQYSTSVTEITFRNYNRRGATNTNYAFTYITIDVTNSYVYLTYEERQTSPIYITLTGSGTHPTIRNMTYTDVHDILMYYSGYGSLVYVVYNNEFYYQNIRWGAISGSANPTFDNYSISASGITHKRLTFDMNAQVSSEAWTYSEETINFSSFSGGDWEAVEGEDGYILNKVSLVKGSGENSVQGVDCEASGKGAFATGYDTEASGMDSYAQGYRSVASGQDSHAEGTTATSYLYISGEANATTYTISREPVEHTNEFLKHNLGVLLYGTVQAKIIDVSNDGSLITVEKTLSSNAINDKRAILYIYSAAIGTGSHAEGAALSIGAASHAEGIGSMATASLSHAEGNYTTASGNYSHAEGNLTTASGNYSHAEGGSTIASTNFSHAEGSNTVASGAASHAEGYYTIANHRSQSVSGEYNIEDPNVEESTNKGDYIEIVGNGTADSARSNARTLDWSGNEWLAGNLKIGGTGYSDANAKTVATTDQIPFVPVQDIQINSTSIVDANGTANIPYASANDVGVVKVGSGLGISNAGTLQVIAAPSSYIKAGSDNTYFSSIKRQHESVFYGLAKAAGDATQSASSNAVGTYTDSAKASIKAMLGITDPTSEIDDTAGAGDTNKTWSADKIVSELTGSGHSTIVEVNPTLETEWEDVYSDWAAGYYYDPDNNYAYTQIPSTERSWGEAETYICTSCTPYNNMIPVKPGEEYRYYNMPIHFDSKNAEVPGVIIFNSNKSEIDAITRTYQDENPSLITIPTGGAWMAVLYANSQTYILQKKVAKRFDKNKLLDTIKADYRAYSLTVPPTPNTLTKTYICLGTDDLRGWETKNLHTLFTSNNIPYYMAAIPDNIKACVTGDPYKTNLDYMRLCVAAGGEIISHSGPVITEQNKNDFDTMYAYFCKNKEQLEHYGFKVRGIFKAGGENAIYNTADPVIDAWATHYYDFGDYFGGEFPYGFERTLLDDWADYSYLANAIRNAMQNHTPFIGAFHYYNSNAELAISTILDVLEDYTEGTDYEFVTPSQLYDIMMSTSRPSGGSGTTPITYSVSMSNNVITLTGSNGSTSSVTLPIYTGGVT